MDSHVGSRLKRPIEGLAKGLAALSGFIGGAAILAMTLLITVDVVGRYLFDRPTGIAVEMSGYMLVALIFFGLGYTESRDRHVTLSFLTSRLAPVLQKALAITNTIAATIFSLWLAWFTAQPAIQDFQLGTVSLTGTQTPIWIPEFFIPVGFAMLGIVLLCKLIMMVCPRSERE